MNALIQAEIKKFNDLQERYRNFGAKDSDSEAIFHLVIARAVSRDEMEVGEPIDWDLVFDDENEDESVLDEPSKALTEQAWTVYRAVQAHATPDDVKELKKLCWRVDPEEFTSWDKL